MANTEYLIQPKLKKVTDDANQFPLDINDNLCSVSGLPQDTMNNPAGSPTYRILDAVSCPLPLPDVTLIVTAGYDDVNERFIFNATLSEVLTADLNIDFNYSFTDGVSPGGNSRATLITAGNLSSGDFYVSYTNVGIVDNIIVAFDDVTPNPNGGRNITY